MTDRDRSFRHATDSPISRPSGDSAPGRTTLTSRHVARAASSSSGTPLPAELRERFEQSTGADLSSVRLHTGADSATAATSVGARAYAVGQDVHFGAGQYDPYSSSGQFLIAHEVAHTIQQRGAAPTRQDKLEVSSPGDAAEVEADVAATAMIAAAPTTISARPAILARGGGDGAGGAAPQWVDDNVQDYEGRDGTGGAPPSPLDGAEGHRPDDPGAEERRRRERANWIRGKETDWSATMVGCYDLEVEVPAFTTAVMPSPDFTYIADEEPYISAIAGVWNDVEATLGTLGPLAEDFSSAAGKAKELKLEKDANDPTTQGWKHPVANRGQSMAAYADQQGADGGPTVGEMFDSGSLDPTLAALSKDKAGFSREDSKTIATALGERSKALDDVQAASNLLEQVTAGEAKTKLLEIEKVDVAIEKATLSVDAEVKKNEIGDIKAEKDRINAAIGIFTGALDGVAGAMKEKNQLLAGLKVTAGTAQAIVNFGFDDQIRSLESQIGAINVRGLRAELRGALIDKDIALNNYKMWLKTALIDKSNAVREAYRAFKEKDQAAADAMRAAAINKTKAEQAKRSPAPEEGDPTARAEQQARDEAEQKKAGAEAESLMHSLSVIETVVAAADRGVAAAKSPPAYTKESGIGYGMIGAPPVLPGNVAAIAGLKEAFAMVKAKWQARQEEVSIVVNSFAL